MNSDSSSPEQTPVPEIVEAAAAAWLSLRDRGMSATETAEFVRWLQQDAQHAAVFTELDRVWKDFDRLGAVPTRPLVAGDPDADLLSPRSRPRHHRALAWSAAGLAAAAAVILLTVVPFRSPHHTAETTVGAFQKIDLPDGSVAQLNTDSAIDTAFTATERRVTVVRGEVFFTVNKDPVRPFVVTAGAVAVRAIGTAFNVRQRDDDIEVLVTEGRVRVDDTAHGLSLLDPAGGSASEPPLLVAGERATVAGRAGDSRPARAIVVKMNPPELQRALAWQERRLEFDKVPLVEVVRDFNRYNQRQLVIADPALAAKRFSGTFRADGYEPFVRLLEENFNVAVTQNEREIVLRLRR